MKREIQLIIILLAAALTAAAQPGFVQTDVPKTPVTTDAALFALPLAQRQTTKVYYDGLGRTIQSIAYEASPTEKDIIQPMAYDTLGRQVTSYLPYGGSSGDQMGSYRANAVATAQPAFYNNTGQYFIPVDAAPYSQRVFENSPLQRLLSAGMDGAGFQPGGTGTQHYKTVNYRPDSTTDGNILLWWSNGTYSGTHYPSKTLRVVDGTDEDGAETLTFTDKMGRTILKRQKLGNTNLDTYYIYNTAGMISYIVPPAAVQLLGLHSTYTLASTPVANLIFNFQYDTRGRLIQKTVPGKGVVYVVYDLVNRPVLVQDANMRANNQWNYIKYDAKNHAISQGIYTDRNTSHIGQSNMQNAVDSLTSAYNTKWYENRSDTLTNGGYYTNLVFPKGTIGGTSISALSWAYYDNYDKNDNGTADFAYKHQGLANEDSVTTAQVKGAPTIINKTTVGSGISSGEWLTTVIFYDKRLNPIQTQSNNQVYYTSPNTITDVKTVVPNFMGVPQISLVSKKTSATDSIYVQTNLTYDQAYRLTSVSQSYKGAAAVVVANYTYNELGQLVTKYLGNTGPSTWLQTISMRYNIRGQLLSLNNATLTTGTGITNNFDPHAVFGMELMYDQKDNNLGNQQWYNGKISAVKWSTRNAAGTRTFERAFKYTYDPVNRYNSAGYAERDTTSMGSFSNNADGYDESAITYDYNGNLLTLKRNSSSPDSNSHVQIDNLHYYYSSSNPNQLQSVSDGMTSQYTTAGFRNITGVDTSHHYTYDPNGNLIFDPFKGLTKLTYDFLNRTDTIKISSSQYSTYSYDGSGELLRKKDFSGSGTLITDYLGGFVYVNGTLSYFPIPEGRVVNNSGTLTQEFIITDQQGNARVSFWNNGNGVVAVKQENSYYGTGQIMLNSPVSPPPATPNKQLYNGGSEWQNTLNTINNLPDYYQTLNRNYDASLGRFVGVDPDAQGAECMSSYQYSGDNPIMFNDPDGNRFGTPQYGNPNVNEFSSSLSGFFWEAVDLNIQNGSTTFGMGSIYPTSGPCDNCGIAYYFDASGKLTDALPNNSEEDSYNKETYNVVQDGSGGYKVLVGFNRLDPETGLSLLSDNGFITSSQGINQPANRFLWIVGASGTVIENFSGSTRLGSDLTIRTATASGRVFMGNQYVLTYKLAKVGKVMGIATFFLGELIDFRGYLIYRDDPSNPDAVSGGKFAMDTFMGAVGLTGWGSFPAAMYFLIDAFYPGGVVQYQKDWADQIQEEYHDNEGLGAGQPYLLF